MPEAAPSKLPGWKLCAIKGPRAELIEQIAAAPDVPPEWKAALIQSVNALPAEIRAVRLDCHCHVLNATVTLTASIAPLY